jgi:hypothetical protein
MIPSDRVSYGRNQDLGTRNDSKFVRCARCGFVCHLDRDRRSRNGARDGEGISYASDITFDASNVGFDSSNITSSTITLQNVHFDGYYIGGSDSSRSTVTAGCPLCGCLLYDRNG